MSGRWRSGSPSLSTGRTPPGWRPRAVRRRRLGHQRRQAWNTGVHRATHDLIFARTSGEPGQARGITAFLVPTDAWFHRAVLLVDVQHAHRPRRGRAEGRPGAGRRGAGRGGPWPRGRPNLPAREQDSAGRQQPGRRAVLHRPRGRLRRRAHGVRQAAGVNQAVQWPLVELQTEAQMVRLLVYAAGTSTATTTWRCPTRSRWPTTAPTGWCARPPTAPCRCSAVGYSRHEPFEHIYRHHRRYRITEGAEEIQIRRVAQRLFGFGQVKEQLAAVLRPVLGEEHREPAAVDRRGEPHHVGVRRRHRGRPAGPDPAHRPAGRRPRGHGAGGPGPGSWPPGGCTRPHILVADDSPAALGNPYLVCDAVGGETIVRKIHRARRRRAPAAAAARTRWRRSTAPIRRRGPQPDGPARRVARPARRDGRHHRDVRMGVSLAGRHRPRRPRRGWCTATSGWAT